MSQQNYVQSDHWALTLVKAPTEEPITLGEVKPHLRVDFPDDDTYITGLITAARVITEERTSRALLTQTWDYVLDGFPAGDRITLRRPKIQSVTTVKYTDSSGVVRIMPASDYIVDVDSAPGRIILGFAKIWPVVVLQPASSVRIQFIAGYSTPEDVPQPLKNAMYFLIGHWYNNREPVSKGLLDKVPMTFDYLIGPYKVWRFQ